MCGRFSQSKTAEFLARTFQLMELPDWQPRYNIAPTQQVPGIVHSAEQGERQFRLLRWGLVPSWSKDLSIGSRLINARAETVAEKPSFRAAFKRRRCLILADGFYEWQRQTGKKQPYYFQVMDHQPFAFAGLWEHWETAETVVESCTIITTEANEVLRSLHNRMPVILPPATYSQWLNPSTPIDQLPALLRPYNPESMQGYPVSTLVNNPSHESIDCIKPLED